MTGRILLQTIRPALNDFHIGFMSMAGAQATKGFAFIFLKNKFCNSEQIEFNESCSLAELNTKRI